MIVADDPAVGMERLSQPGLVGEHHTLYISAHHLVDCLLVCREFRHSLNSCAARHSPVADSGSRSTAPPRGWPIEKPSSAPRCRRACPDSRRLYLASEVVKISSATSAAGAWRRSQ